MIFEEQAKCILNDIKNEQAIEHWLFNQDFFIEDEMNDVLPDAAIAGFLSDAGATHEQINLVLKIAHQNDPEINYGAM